MSRLEVDISKRFLSPPSSGDALAGFHLDISLRCEAGITILFGASGAGKTLTLDAVAGFYRPDQGRILLDDAILFDAASGISLPPQRRNVGYVFQNYALFPHMNVEQNLAFGIQHLPPVERGRRIHEQLSRFGIAAKAKRLPGQLSGGEKQRASIARALIGQPRILLLDEPVRGLDHPLRLDFYETLRQVREQHQIPILLVTHDAEEACMLADRIAVIEAGRVVQWDRADEIFQRPVSGTVARLLGIRNLFAGAIESLDSMAGTTVVRAGSLLLTLPYVPGRLRGDSLEFCVRSERIKLHDPAAPPAARPNLWHAQFQQARLTPTVARLSLGIEPPGKRSMEPETGLPVVEAEVARQFYDEMQMKERRRWVVEIPPHAAHIFPGKMTA